MCKFLWCNGCHFGTPWNPLKLSWKLVLAQFPAHGIMADMLDPHAQTTEHLNHSAADSAA